MNTTASMHPDLSASPSNRRLRLVLLVAIPLVIAMVGVGLWWRGGRYVETDNAYLKADMVPLGADVSAAVERVLVTDNQRVAAGQELFRLDDSAYVLAVDESKARLAEVRTELAALQASYREQLAAIDLAESQLAFAGREQQRLQNLIARQLVAGSKVDEARQTTRLAELQLAAAERERQRIEQALGGDAAAAIEAHPRYLAAAVELAKRELDLKKTVVVAPMAGVVSNPPKVGQYLKVGDVAMALVIGDGLWIEANFPETDLTHFREGQTAAISVDMYPNSHFSGVVESLSPATGAAFALIPAQNATGNWVKITQRVPVRIRLEHSGDLPSLRAGLSAVVRVDTGYRRQLFGKTL